MTRLQRKAKLSEPRLRQLSLLYPEQEPQKVAVTQEKRRRRQLLFGFFATLLLILASTLMPTEGYLKGNRLRRPEPGTVGRRQELLAQVNGQEYDMELWIGERELTAAEQEAVLDEAEEVMRRQLAGENASLSQVSQPLNLTSECPVPGVEAWWQPMESELILWDGSLAEAIVPGEGRETALRLSLAYGERERVVEVPVILCAEALEPLSVQEKLLVQLQKAEAKEAEQGYVELPGSIDGSRVSYREPKASLAPGLAALGFLATLALWFRNGQEIRKALANREQELALSYAEFASRLKLLLGAGLSVRMVWERMVTDYENERAQGGRRRLVYEEMRRTSRALSQGMLEGEAYSDFGRRCGQAAYIRMGNYLESQLRNGGSGFGRLLEAEVAEAFRERLLLARKQGEQISAKLLLPLMLLFGLVMFLLVIPAFL